MRNKDEIVIRQKKAKLVAAIAIVLLLLACSIIRMTSLVGIYEINLVTEIITNNTVNLVFISIILTVLHVIERRQYSEKIKDMNYEKED